MSASDLLKRVQSLPAGQPLPWREIREEIHTEFDTATMPADRELLLALFKVVMDLVERGIAQATPEKLEEFRNARLADYKLLIVKESTIGENVCAETLIEVTDREIAAGRMTPDNDLRALALARVAEPHPSRAELIAMAEKKRRSTGGFAGALRRIFGG